MNNIQQYIPADVQNYIQHNVSSEPPTKLEVYDAIQHVKNTTPGPDGIHIYLIQHGGEAVKRSTFYICRQIWDTRSWPQVWADSGGTMPEAHSHIKATGRSDIITCLNKQGNITLSTG